MENNSDDDYMLEDQTESLSSFLAGMTEGQKMYDLTVLYLLKSSKRFIDFVNENFDVQHNIDKETKAVDIRVVEKPFTQPPFKISDEAAARVSAMLGRKYDVENPGRCMMDVLAIINGKDVSEPSLIATEADIEAELAASRVASKLIKG
jgi:hypothetical protein